MRFAFHGKSATKTLEGGEAHFRYLQGTKVHGLRFHPSDKIDFRGYSDADLADDLADRKSTSGTIMLMGAPVSWGSKEHSTQVCRCRQVKQNTLR